MDAPARAETNTAAQEAAPAARGGEWRTLRSYLRPARRLLVGLFFLELIAEGATLIQPLVARSVIEHLEEGRSLLWPVLMLSGIAVVGMVLSWLGTFLIGRAGTGLVRDVRQRLVRRILGAKVAGVERRPVGDFLSRVGSDTTLLQATMADAVVEAAAAPIAILGAIVLMGVIDPVMLALVVGLLAITTVGERYALRRVGEATEQEQARVGSMTAALQRVLIAFRTVKASGTERHEQQQVGSQADGAYRAGVRSARAEAWVEVIAGASMDVTFLVVLAVGATRVASGELGIGGLIAFLLYVMYLREPVETLFDAATDFSEGLAAVRRVEELNLLPQEGSQAVGPGTRSLPRREDGQLQIRCEGVWFGYRDRPVLQDVSFTAGRGLTVLVGPSGAGKTTLLSLVERFADVDRGRILLDGVDVRELSRSELRRRLAYVQQEAPLLGETVREAALYGVPHPEEADLDEALRSVALDTWVNSLPDGLDTPVGERGVEISGGQRQRLAVARALLRDADVLLLDEATAQLDAISERTLLDSLAHQSHERTVLAITHRLSVAAEADQLVLLDEGRVRAVGRHDDLLTADSMYRELVTAFGAQGNGRPPLLSPTER
ncbi:putative ABC transporter ATP-binding protein [Longimycelium tulufanense]|uniref:Putative ABC transporter ATP-binding protein n=1 Tax=Longimycelium tulufanense TaxID=907463 RepID=A0A8J3CBM1_9PSEU|nr:putative ABC transporter ATP-binding protein [Longimycelium tulufanense]